MAEPKRSVWGKTVKLTSGGFIRVEIIGHPLDMAEDDRTFVEQIVDNIAEYEDDAKTYGPEASATPGPTREGT